MGTPIGSASIAISSLNTAGASRLNRQVAPPVPTEEIAGPVRREETPPDQVGFGENTLSPQTAALATLDSNLEAAENIVATVGELRERARVVAAEQSAETPRPRSPERPDEFRRLETVRSEADSAVRNFVQEADPLERPESAAAPDEVTETRGRPVDTTPVPASPFPGANANRIDFFA